MAEVPARRDFLMLLRPLAGSNAHLSGDRTMPADRVAAIGSTCLNQAGTVREACPERAIRVMPRLRQAPIIAVREAGCGECLPACPVAAIGLEEMPHA